MAKYLFIEGNRDGYTPKQCYETLTVGELISILENYDEDLKVYLRNDDGYTYGSISYRDLSTNEELGEFLDDEEDEE